MQVIASFVAAVLVAGVSCQTPAMPMPCCTATKFHASMVKMESVNSDVLEIFGIASDYDAQMEFLMMNETNTATGQTTTIYKIITDYAQSVQYVLPMDPQSNGVCLKGPTTSKPFGNCIPDDAQFLASAGLGLSGQLPIDAWRFSSGMLNVTMAMSTQGCAPVAIGMLGHYNNAMINATYLYTSFEEGLPMGADTFALPPACQHALNLDGSPVGK